MKVVYFTDRDLGNQFPKILKAAGLTVERHADHFAHDAPDEEWLATAGAKGWIALTHNSRIRYTPNEKAAVITYRVRLLVIVGQAPYPVLARSFVATRARVEAFLAKHAPPFIAKVYRPSPAEMEGRADRGHTFVFLEKHEALTPGAFGASRCCQQCCQNGHATPEQLEGNSLRRRTRATGRSKPLRTRSKSLRGKVVAGRLGGGVGWSRYDWGGRIRTSALEIACR